MGWDGVLCLFTPGFGYSRKALMYVNAGNEIVVYWRLFLHEYSSRGPCLMCT
jgi:hypothetical protein